jgi:hypothetical protein
MSWARLLELSSFESLPFAAAYPRHYFSTKLFPCILRVKAKHSKVAVICLAFEFVHVVHFQPPFSKRCARPFCSHPPCVVILTRTLCCKTSGRSKMLCYKAPHLGLVVAHDTSLLSTSSAIAKSHEAIPRRNMRTRTRSLAKLINSSWYVGARPG